MTNQDFLTVSQMHTKHPEFSERFIRNWIKKDTCPGFPSGNRFYIHETLFLEKVEEMCRFRGAAE